MGTVAGIVSTVAGIVGTVGFVGIVGTLFVGIAVVVVHASCSFACVRLVTSCFYSLAIEVIEGIVVAAAAAAAVAVAVAGGVGWHLSRRTIVLRDSVVAATVEFHGTVRVAAAVPFRWVVAGVLGFFLVARDVFDGNHWRCCVCWKLEEPVFLEHAPDPCW